MTRYFCTYFDRNYLPRGLALYESLRRHCPAFKLRVLCMDRISHEALTMLELPDVHAIALADCERGDKDLLEAKPNRTLIEYYFTCSLSSPLFIFENHTMWISSRTSTPIYFSSPIRPRSSTSSA